MEKIRPVKYRIYSLLITFFLIFTIFVLYLQLYSHQFINLDDPVYVLGNPHVTSGLTWQNIIWAFTTFRAEFWHPITWLSYMADTQLFGVRPGAYLFTNLLLHVSITVLLFYVLQLMTDEIWTSGVIAAFFAVHPLHVETVAWIAERKALLCAFFWMLTLLSYAYYARRPSILRYFLVCICFIAGLMSKPMIITLPFVLLLLDYWPLERIRNWPATGRRRFGSVRSRRLILEKVPLILLAIGDGIITIIAQGRGGGLGASTAYTLHERIANAVIAYGMYLKKTIWPVDLAVFYPFPTHIRLTVFFGVLLLLVVITGLCAIARRRYPYLIVGWLWYLGTLVPVIGIIKIGDFAMADRYMYIPLIGLLLMAVFGARDLFARLQSRWIWNILVPASLLVCAAKITFHQIGTWKNSVTLYRQALKVTENNFLAHYGLGNYYAATDQTDNAIYQFLQAVQIRPDKATLWNNLGRAFVQKGLWSRAVRCFNEGIRRHPHYSASYYFLGCALIHQKEYTEAITNLSIAADLHFNPNTHYTIANHAASLYKQKNVLSDNVAVDRMIAKYQKELASAPHNTKALTTLAAIYSGSQRYADAFSLFRIPMDPGSARKMILAGYANWPLIHQPD